MILFVCQFDKVTIQKTTARKCITYISCMKRGYVYILLECEVFRKCPVYIHHNFQINIQAVLSSSHFFDLLLKLQSWHSFTGYKGSVTDIYGVKLPTPKLLKPIYKALIDASFKCSNIDFF